MLIPLSFYFLTPKGEVVNIINLSLLITAGEWLQEHIFILSFPWSGVWLSVTDSPIIIQSANLFGAQFVSFLILIFSGFFELLLTKKNQRLKALCYLSIIFTFVSLYGTYSIKNIQVLTSENEKISVACVQDDCEGTKKDSISSFESANIYKEIINNNSISAQIILLPETALTCELTNSCNEFEIISNISKNTNSIILTGCFFKSQDKTYNALIAIDNEEISLPYCKQILVPFGEKSPFSFITKESQLWECTENDKLQPLEVRNTKIGCVVCIESIYSSIVREQSANGCEILCVSTNDSWFGNSFARNQHFRHSIMRAAENRKWLIRAGNCGISAIISPSGKITQQLTSRQRGGIQAQAALIEEESLFSKTGNIFICIPTFLIAISIFKRFTNN